MNNKDKNYVINKLTGAHIQQNPFLHIEIENFFPTDVANKLYNEFPSFDSDLWFNYKNKIEDKKLLSDWRKFPKQTYQTFTFLNSDLLLSTLSNLIGCSLHADHGLHGGGWHIHANGGKLNPHLDYSIHPMLKLQRKLNLIVYLCKDWDDSYGGHFGLYEQDKEKVRAGKLVKEISMGFNKAVIFDTTQDSWHGLSREINCPESKYRKSLAVYYLTTPSQGVDQRDRALFSPTADQQQDASILELIKMRADFNKSKEVYLG
jgi:Rps23 Pro-64 3,4-dihydroxylase Tpa1-like proline 4-hydroxylase